MEEKGKSSPSLDVRTALLVVTVLGGAYLIPTSLQSSRPSEKESLERTAVGDQVVPARLWQDPFEAAQAYREKNKETLDDETKSTAEAGLERIRFHSLSEVGNQILRQARPESGGTTSFRPVTILEVMMSGGSYAEDAELRRRSHYAVLSALSVAGYVPWDAEHIGYAEERWPRGKELERGSKDQVSTLDSTPKHNDSRLIVPFEWFVPNQLARRGNRSSVLVLWLNENAFADHPAKRLAQFNHFLRSQLKDGPESSARNSLTNITRIKLLEPRLHSMLNEPFGTENNLLAGTGQSNNLISLSAELADVELYSSWSTTADAVLTTNSGWPRRSSISRQLSALGWGTNFFNATCTDDELVEELIDELALRGTDLANGKDAVALISEWDTFYGRALPLTFAAMVKCRMDDILTNQAIINPDAILARLRSTNLDRASSNLLNHLFEETRRGLESKVLDRLELTHLLVKDCNRIIQQGCPMVERLQIFTTNDATKLLIASRTNLSKGKLIHLNRLLLEDAFPGSIKRNRFADAVESLRTAKWPSNIFRYTYLRGVDGKVPGAGQPEPKSGKEQSKEKDKNDAGDETARPEGHGQLDYLPRMLDRLAAREGAYEHRGRGELKAIGVLGSDVYDKLLLLQSLRPQFKDELFFTTDLDARLFHPRELKWSRNVIVASSFGLMLKGLQKEVLPFRDTYQTGEFLACLAALGYPPAVTNLPFLAPRRFEIGRSGAFDLSVGGGKLHQRAPWERRDDFFNTVPWVPWLFVIATLGLLLWHYTPGKRRTAGTTDPVRFSTDDITDLPTLACKLKQPSESDSVSHYLSSQLAGRTSDLLSRYQGGSDPELQQALVEDLNRIIGRGIYDSDRFKDVKLWPETKKLLGQNNRGNDLVRLNRLLLEDSYPLEIAESRKVRQWTAWTCIISILVLLSLSGIVCFDHFRIEGQPFALTQGISIWPTELIRVAAAGLAAIFFFRSRSKLLQTKKEWIREYGLPAIMTRKGVKKLWQDPDARRKWGGWEPPATGGLVWRKLRWINIANWEAKMTGADMGGGHDNSGCGDEPAFSKGADGSQQPRISGDELCKGYNLLGFWWHRVYRLTLPILGFLVLSVAIGHLFTPFTPSRGVWSFWVERFAVCVSFLLQTVLILFVVDASRLCRKFVEILTEAETQWPEKTCQIFEDKLGLNREYLSEYITIKVIAERTEAVGKLIFYPFLILLLTVVSRSSYFDRWQWPVSLILVYGLSSLLAVYAVWQLRGAAEEARESALASLNGKLFRALGGKPKAGQKMPPQDTAAPAGAAQKGEKERPEQSPDGKNLVEQLRVLVRKVESCEEGALAPVTRQPVVRALLMPVGGAGLVALLQFLASKQ